MRHKLVLSLTGDRLILELVSSETAGLGPVLRGLFQRGMPVGGNWSPVARVDLVVQAVVGNLLPSLGQALSELQAQHGGTLAGMPLEVQLGLDHAQIGLVDLSGVSPGALAAKNCDAYAHAWVAQMLHMDPSTALIRWELFEHAQKLLVSCVGRHVVDVLTDFSAHSDLRFSSCRPAVLSALVSYRTRDVRAEPLLARDLAWTEVRADGRRSSKVQLVRLQGRHLSALWRGWVPQTLSNEDVALDGAIGRFQRINSPESDVPVERIVWPAPAATGTLS